MGLVEEHMEVARKITGWYILKFSAYQYKEDLQSAAVLGVVDAVSRINTGHVKHSNYYGYICCYIHQYLRNEVRKNQQLIPPARNPKPLPCRSLNIDIERKDPAIPLLELEEELDVLIGNDNQLRKIVDLRIEGKTDQEIADLLGVGRLVVQRARKRLLTHWRKHNVR